jgi:hypothetical protein
MGQGKVNALHPIAGLELDLESLCRVRNSVFPEPRARRRENSKLAILHKYSPHACARTSPCLGSGPIKSLAGALVR